MIFSFWEGGGGVITPFRSATVRVCDDSMQSAHALFTVTVIRCSRAADWSRHPPAIPANPAIPLPEIHKKDGGESEVN